MTFLEIFSFLILPGMGEMSRWERIEPLERYGWAATEEQRARCARRERRLEALRSKVINFFVFALMMGLGLVIQILRAMGEKG